MKFTRLVIALLTLASASALHAQAPVVPVSGGLSPGDQIRIVVFRKPELSGDFPIAADGTIIHPLYREVQVTNVPLSTVEERLRTFLSKYETAPQFVIQPLVKIIVGGEVRTPNIYMVPPETTIAQALALAGGPTDRGLINDVRVVRDRQEIRVDVSKPESDAQLLQIRSNDQILVMRRRTSAFQYLAPVTSSIAAAAAITSIFIRH
jgi:protein involved in polysaccharide export with SLBB domain